MQRLLHMVAEMTIDLTPRWDKFAVYLPDMHFIVRDSLQMHVQKRVLSTVEIESTQPYWETVAVSKLVRAHYVALNI